MEKKNINNSEIEPLLVAGGVASLFPLYVCQRKPSAVSQCVVSDAGIQGCAVTGRNCDLPWIYSHWLMARTKQVMLLLLNYLREVNAQGIQLNYPLEYTDEVRNVFPEKETSVDNVYILIPSKLKEMRTVHPITQITEELLNRIEIPDEMKSFIGSNYSAYDKMPLYGIVIDNQLTAIAEAICDSGTYTAIQQVYTNTTHRGHGIGTMLVGSIAADIVKQGKTPTYWVAEDNHTSIHLAEKLGFELSIRLGCAD